MKNKIFIILSLIILLSCAIGIGSIYNKNVSPEEEKFIIGTVVSIDNDLITIETSDEGKYVLIVEDNKHNIMGNLEIGSNIKAYYYGEIMESDPAKIIIESIEFE